MRIGETGLSIARSPKVRPVRATPSGSRAVRPRHAPSRAFVGAVFRYAELSDIHGLAGRLRFPPSSHAPGGAPGSICGPSQVCSRKRVARHFCRSGPTCHSTSRVPARLIFVGPDRAPQRGERSPASEVDRSWDLVVGEASDFWALTPICDPHPPAHSWASEPILPWALPLAGLSGT